VSKTSVLTGTAEELPVLLHLEHGQAACAARALAQVADKPEGLVQVGARWAHPVAHLHLAVAVDARIAVAQELAQRREGHRLDSPGRNIMCAGRLEIDTRRFSMMDREVIIEGRLCAVLAIPARILVHSFNMCILRIIILIIAQVGVRPARGVERLQTHAHRLHVAQLAAAHLLHALGGRVVEDVLDALQAAEVALVLAAAAAVLGVGQEHGLKLVVVVA